MKIRVRSSLLLILILIITLNLVILPSLGVQISVGISSSGTINYPGERLPGLHVEGTYIRDEVGATVYLKGVNVHTHTWWTMRWIDERQVIYMKEWGCNVLRITIETWSLPELRTNEVFRSKLSEIISLAEKHGLYVVISGRHLFKEDLSGWGDAEWNTWIEDWKIITTLCKGRTNVLYDLLNEPTYVESRAVYQAKMHQCIDAIRAIDPNVICIVEMMSTGGWGWDEMGFHWVETHPINRTNIIYSGHLYWDPGVPTDLSFWTTVMERRYWNYLLESDRCLWVGEFNGRVGYPSESEAWLRMIIPTWDAMGCSGYAAWLWTTETIQPWRLLDDWNGTPSITGKVIREYLK